MSGVIRRPNLFIIGSMKSGTTTLHEHLDSHPQIAMSRIKEPGYFVEELNQRQGEDWYLSLFEQDDCFRYRGESSTHYTKLPVYRGVADRLFRFNPDVRLIYIMRNPIDRLLSHYLHNVRDPVYGRERRALLQAVRKRPDYVAFGDYAMQLEPFINLFGRNALYTLTFEALIKIHNASSNNFTIGSVCHRTQSEASRSRHTTKSPRRSSASPALGCSTGLSTRARGIGSHPTFPHG